MLSIKRNLDNGLRGWEWVLVDDNRWLVPVNRGWTEGADSIAWEVFEPAR
jgi:hypothetical protein